MTLVFAIPDAFDATALTWYRSDAPGDVEQLHDLSGPLRADSYHLVVSGRDVYSGVVNITSRSEKELRTAALFQLEDDLAEPVSAMFVALGEKPTAAGVLRPVNVVSLNQMRSWVDILGTQPAPLSSAHIVADTSLCTGQPPFIFDGDDVVILHKGEKSWAIDADLANELLPAMTGTSLFEDYEYVEGSSPVLRSRASEEGARASYPALVSRLLWAQSGIDLRQGEFRRAQPMQFGFAKRWTGTLVLAAAALAAWIGFLGVSVVQLNSETERLYQEAANAYVSAFPGSKNVVDPHANVMSRLRTAPQGGGAPVTALLSVFYQQIEAVPGVELDSLSYSQSSGRLTAGLRFSGYQDRDLLKQALERNGFSASMGGVTQENGFLVGQAIVGVQP